MKTDKKRRKARFGFQEVVARLQARPGAGRADETGNRGNGEPVPPPRIASAIWPEPTFAAVVREFGRNDRMAGYLRFVGRALAAGKASLINDFSSEGRALICIGTARVLEGYAKTWVEGTGGVTQEGDAAYIMARQLKKGSVGALKAIEIRWMEGKEDKLVGRYGEWDPVERKFSNGQEIRS